jgi:hypothetical protein
MRREQLTPDKAKVVYGAKVLYLVFCSGSSGRVLNLIQIY